jgi:hypothetical protein
MNRRVLAMVLAGGREARLLTLTKDGAKSAVPFGGKCPNRRLCSQQPDQLWSLFPLGADSL